MEKKRETHTTSNRRSCSVLSISHRLCSGIRFALSLSLSSQLGLIRISASAFSACLSRCLPGGYVFVAVSCCCHVEPAVSLNLAIRRDGFAKLLVQLPEPVYGIRWRSSAIRVLLEAARSYGSVR